MRTRRKEKEIKNKEARERKGEEGQVRKEGKDRKHMENSMMGNKNDGRGMRDRKDRRGGFKSSKEIITIIIIIN